MRKYITIAILLLIVLSSAIYIRHYIQGAIITKEFSHDLRLLHYNGWQYILRQPANYRDYKTLEFRFWHDIYENSAVPKLIKSNRPETAWTKATAGIPRELPIDILVEKYPTGNSKNWGYTALLDFSGTGSSLMPNEDTSLGISLPGKVEYVENTPMLLGSVTIYGQGGANTSMYRFYLEVSYSK